MQKRFKPLLAAAVAAGAIPLLDNVSHVSAAVITAAGFTFDTQTATSNTAGSISVSADTFSPGYGGSLLATFTNTTGQGWAFSNGNGSAKAINGMTWAQGGYYNFAFDIDDLNAMVIRFDMRSTTVAPGQFIIQTSLDGSTFNNAATVTNTLTNAWSTVPSNSITADSFSFTLPTSFSDSLTGVLGQTAYIRLLGVTFPNVTGGTVANGGANVLDNVFITGQKVPEPSAMVMTLAAAAGLVSRGKRREI